jgi:hypothetical protein
LVAGFIILLAICFLALGLWSKFAIDRRWDAVAVKIHALEEHSLNRYDAQEAKALAELRFANGWNDYARALVEVWTEGLPEDEYFEQLIYNSAENGSFSKYEKVAKACRDAVHLLQSGARKEKGLPRLGWEPTMAGLRTLGDNLGELGLTALCTVRYLRASHYRAEAFDFLLETISFALDMAADGFPDTDRSALFILWGACNHLRWLIDSKELSDSQFARIAAALEDIEHRFPLEGSVVRSCVTQMGSCFLRGETLRDLFGAVRISVKGPIAPGWRFMFSEKLMEVDAIERWFRVIEIWDTIPYRPWKEAQSLESWSKDFLKSAPPNGRAKLLADMLPALSRRRGVLAQVRILRTVVHSRLTGEVLQLPDPFGKMLSQKREARILKIWSVGPDGVNHGGVGEWTPFKGKDIVLQVRQ